MWAPFLMSVSLLPYIFFHVWSLTGLAIWYVDVSVWEMCCCLAISSPYRSADLSIVPSKVPNPCKKQRFTQLVSYGNFLVSELLYQRHCSPALMVYQCYGLNLLRHCCTSVGMTPVHLRATASALGLRLQQPREEIRLRRYGR